MALYWFYGSLFDLLYDFSQVCDHALSAHVRENARKRPEDRGTFRWTLSRSPVAATLWLQPDPLSAVALGQYCPSGV